MDKIIKNKCCCCGGEVIAKYQEGDETGKAFAEEADVCVACFRAGCKVLTGKKCEVTNRKQIQRRIIKLDDKIIELSKELAELKRKRA